jgi:hypothetical protein
MEVACPSKTQALCDSKTVLWCSMSTDRIIETIFFKDTINSERYMEEIMLPIF